MSTNTTDNEDAMPMCGFSVFYTGENMYYYVYKQVIAIDFTFTFILVT